MDSLIELRAVVWSDVAVVQLAGAAHPTLVHSRPRRGLRGGRRVLHARRTSLRPPAAAAAATAAASSRPVGGPPPRREDHPPSVDVDLGRPGVVGRRELARSG